MVGALVDLPEIGRIETEVGADRGREALSRARNRIFRGNHRDIHDRAPGARPGADIRLSAAYLMMNIRFAALVLLAARRAAKARSRRSVGHCAGMVARWTGRPDRLISTRPDVGFRRRLQQVDQACR